MNLKNISILWQILMETIHSVRTQQAEGRAEEGPENYVQIRGAGYSLPARIPKVQNSL